MKRRIDFVTWMLVIVLGAMFALLMRT